MSKLCKSVHFQCPQNLLLSEKTQDMVRDCDSLSLDKAVANPSLTTAHDSNERRASFESMYHKPALIELQRQRAVKP